MHPRVRQASARARGLFFPAGGGAARGGRDRRRLPKRERALRLQMVGQLASGVAHNFNNIIAAILGYSEMAGSEVETGGKAARRIAEIERAAERGRDLVDSILTFGRRSNARSSLVSITELLS